MHHIIYIKNMVCPRCITAVSVILNKLCIPYKTIKLGEVYLEREPDDATKTILAEELIKSGFSLINDRKSQLVGQMRSLVIERIHHSNEPLDIKWPEYVNRLLHLDYKYLSSLFSSVERITFEQYIINQKIERVKELIAYDELSLNEIAFQMNYSSVAYLSNQFKKVTGMNPSHFKKSIEKNRKSLDKI